MMLLGFITMETIVNYKTLSVFKKYNIKNQCSAIHLE